MHPEREIRKPGETVSCIDPGRAFPSFLADLPTFSTSSTVIGMKDTIIAPSVLAADLGRVTEQLKAVEKAGADWLHIDVMDGTFVPAISFGANMVALAKSVSSLPLDTHLMVVQPERHIEAFASAGASRLTVHQEACPHLHRVLSEIRQAGMTAGVAVNPGTPIESIFDVLDLCDLILVMTVNPGKGGQTFLESCLRKLLILRDRLSRDALDPYVQVDGGITIETAQKAKSCGATTFVAGTSIFGAADIHRAISELRVC
jgi:ribulose-phosphate 3-epimerase